MFESIKRLWRIKALRNSILFVLLTLVLFRFLAHIPVPGIDPAIVRNVLNGNQFFGLLNIFSGGTLESFSVVALGVAPYITSSIIFQLLTMVVPALKKMQKEDGEAGRRKLNQVTRWVSVPLAAIQAYGFIALISRQGGVGGGFLLSGFELFMAILVMTAGAVFLMWIGEIISEKGIGNGLSILILAGIVSSFPKFLQQTISTFSQAQIVSIILFAVVALVSIVLITILNEAHRDIPVNYARHHAGNRLSAGVASNIPLKVITAGVIPIIFAISVVLFPTMIAQFFLQARTPFLVESAQWVIRVLQDNLVYGILYFILVFAFTYFYTGVVFQPDDIAENLQKQGAFIPGVRPGKTTSVFLQDVMNRLLLLGATALSVIAVLPVVMQEATGTQTLVVGGTSLLIVVSVI
ncbi:preprotein translocase subunit SecY, partial [Candidatus Uhrbacteria bacterium]|nr:preprotein translocase subunit SecY [Candidatus Uhrbacteria bacterium]